MSTRPLQTTIPLLQVTTPTRTLFFKIPTTTNLDWPWWELILIELSLSELILIKNELDMNW